jgi:hypothetical protein
MWIVVITDGTFHEWGTRMKPSQVPVARAYNPSYSGGRDQKDHGSKPALGK